MDSSSQTTASAAAEAGGNGAMIQQSNDLSPVQSSAASGVSAVGLLAYDPKQNLTQIINSIQKAGICNATLAIGNHPYHGTTLSGSNKPRSPRHPHQLYLTVSSFHVAAQLPLLQAAAHVILRTMFLMLGIGEFTLVSELDNMTKLAENCNIQVPMDVINLIDDGKNPDEFTRNVLNGCIAKNQIAKGKTDAFKGLRRHLLEQLDLTFPDEVEANREIRASSAAESKRLAQLQSLLPNGDVKVKAENGETQCSVPDVFDSSWCKFTVCSPTSCICNVAISIHR